MGEDDSDKGREIHLNLDEDPPTSDDWAKLLKEMEEAPAQTRPKPARPKEAPQEEQTSGDPPLERINRALGQIAESRQALEAFVKAHPYLIAPNLHRMWEDALKEVAYTMERQRDALAGQGGGTPEESEPK